MGLFTRKRKYDPHNVCRINIGRFFRNLFPKLGVKKEIKHRNNTIRSYINNRVWDENPEFLLTKKVINNLKERRPELEKFIFVYDYEWEVESGATDKGKGDLIFTDGRGNFLIVECKTKDSNEVRKQVLDYREKFKNRNPEVKNIWGLAKTPQTTYFIDENMHYWDIKKTTRDLKYFQLYDKIVNPEELEKRGHHLEVYREIGYAPKNPINALNELRDADIIKKLNYSSKNNNHPPFEWEITIETGRKLDNKEYHEKCRISKKKRLAKAITAARICEQIYLPYHMKEWRYPIDTIKYKKND